MPLNLAYLSSKDSDPFSHSIPHNTLLPAIQYSRLQYLLMLIINNSCARPALLSRPVTAHTCPCPSDRPAMTHKDTPTPKSLAHSYAQQFGHIKPWISTPTVAVALYDSTHCRNTHCIAYVVFEHRFGQTVSHGILQPQTQDGNLTRSPGNTTVLVYLRYCSAGEALYMMRSYCNCWGTPHTKSRPDIDNLDFNSEQLAPNAKTSVCTMHADCAMPAWP